MSTATGNSAARGATRRAFGYLRDYAVITAGVTMLAVANDLFLIPNDVFSGGATGLALVISNFVPVPVGVLVLLINVPLVIAGIIWLGGWRFLARTSYAVVAYAILLDLLRPLFTTAFHDPLIYTLYGGLLGGVGVGLVFRAQGTTGGDDIGAQLLNRFMAIPVNGALVIINAAIFVLVGLTFSPEKALYALIAAFASGQAVKAVLEGFRPALLMYIISKEPEPIASKVQITTGRGITYLSGMGAYTGTPYRVILTALRQQDVPVVTNIVREIDPDAFIIVNEAREVMGLGFKDIPRPQEPVTLRIPRALRPRIRRRVRFRQADGGGKPTG